MVETSNSVFSSTCYFDKNSTIISKNTVLQKLHRQAITVEVNMVVSNMGINQGKYVLWYWIQKNLSSFRGYKSYNS